MSPKKDEFLALFGLNGDDELTEEDVEAMMEKWMAAGFADGKDIDGSGKLAYRLTDGGLCVCNCSVGDCAVMDTDSEDDETTETPIYRAMVCEGWPVKVCAECLRILCRFPLRIKRLNDRVEPYHGTYCDGCGAEGQEAPIANQIP